MRCFRSCHTGGRAIEGEELARMMRKGQVKGFRTAGTRRGRRSSSSASACRGAGAGRFTILLASNQSLQRGLRRLPTGRGCLLID